MCVGGVIVWICGGGLEPGAGEITDLVQDCDIPRHGSEAEPWTW